MTLSGIWEGVLSLRGVKNLPLYLFLSVGIWVMYFLHYYLTFFCFDFTENLGIGCALVSFVVANFAVIVPTPNGAGPLWCGRRTSPVVRAHRAYHTNATGSCLRHLRMGSITVYKTF